VHFSLTGYCDKLVAIFFYDFHDNQLITFRIGLFIG